MGGPERQRGQERRQNGGATAAASGGQREAQTADHPLAVLQRSLGNQAVQRPSFPAAVLFLSLATLPAVTQEEPPPPGAREPVQDEITVTATRTEQRLGETAASVVVLSAEEVASTAAQTVDDALRQVPGFSLFRRSGSRYANPTAQGVSLRGLGASGASRAVVLADGIPLNDPFGGWVYWSRVPRTALDRVEVMRGAASDLYGSGALAGAVQLFRRPALPGQLLAEVSYGERETPEGSVFASHGNERWGVSLGAEGFATDGYVAIDPRERGPVDTAVASRHSTVDLTVERRTVGGARLFLRGSHFDEERDNGTRRQNNDTEIRQWSLGAEGALPRWDGGSYWLRAYAGDQDFRQGFTAVAADRASERLTRSQEVPADSRGLSTQVSRAAGAGGRLALVAGLDLREVSGTSRELVFTGTGQTRVDAGGKQQTGGLFLEGIAALSPRLSLTAGGRYDAWRNDEIGGGPVREESAFSPRISLLFQATDAFALTASAYRAFRAPTLNELYRAFRVGDVLTLANEDLEAERLSGGEAGALWSGTGRRLTARATLFWMEIDRNIANVTLTVEPGLITRQRQNLGRTRSRGLEAELTARPNERWTFSGGYLLSDARVRSFPANPELEGLRLPQIPRHQLTAQVRFDAPEWANVGVQARWTGDQPDDDQNRFRLGGSTTVDALVSCPLRKGFSAFVAVENLFDERYEVGRTPVRTFGSPRAVRIGLRVERVRS